MEFDYNRLETLRNRLKICFAFLHQDDGKASFVKSEIRSTNNPFLKALRVDIDSKYPEDTPSLDIFYELFFKTDKYNYSSKSIEYLEFFCDVVEKEIQDSEEEEEETPPAKRPYIKWITLGLSLVVLLVVIVSFPINILFEDTAIFDTEDSRYKILILPFKQQCEYDGSLKNVGYVIENRLMELDQKDSLNLHVRYEPDFNLERSQEDLTWTDYYRRIMDENHADHIIYGDTREENCSASNVDEVCVNFLLSKNRPSSETQSTNILNTFEQASIPDISDGKLQGTIDMIIYYQTAWAIEPRDPYKALYYLDQILESDYQSQDDKTSTRIYKLNILARLGLYEHIAKECEFLLEMEPTDPAVLIISIYCNSISKDLPIEEIIQSVIKEEDSRAIFANIFKAINTVPNDLEGAKQSMEYILENSSDVLLKATITSAFAKELFNHFHYDEAIHYSSLGLKESPENFSLLMDRGIAYLSEGRSLIKAEADFKKALELIPSSSHAHFRLAITYLFMKNMSKYEFHFSKSIELDPNNPYLYEGIIDALFKAGAYEEMLEVSEDALERYPSDYNLKFSTLVYGAYAKKRLGRNDEFLKDSLQILELEPLFFKQKDSMKAIGRYVIE